MISDGFFLFLKETKVYIYDANVALFYLIVVMALLQNSLIIN